MNGRIVDAGADLQGVELPDERVALQTGARVVDETGEDVSGVTLPGGRR